MFKKSVNEDGTTSKEIKYNIVDGFDHVFDEKGNMFLALRKITWGDNTDVKLDLRRWFTNSSGEETPGKGLSFITDEGPNELTKVLLDTGYGKTSEVIESIKDRDDFKPSILKVLGKESIEELGLDSNIEDDGTEMYYDPKDLIL